MMMQQTSQTEQVEDFTNRHTRPIRLDILEGAKGMRWFPRIVFQLIIKMNGVAPSPLLVLTYKRGIFGKWFAQFAQRAMRQSDHWKKEELELFAAFTANRLNCDY